MEYFKKTISRKFHKSRLHWAAQFEAGGAFVGAGVGVDVGVDVGVGVGVGCAGPDLASEYLN